MAGWSWQALPDEKNHKKINPLTVPAGFCSYEMEAALEAVTSS